LQTWWMVVDTENCSVTISLLCLMTTMMIMTVVVAAIKINN